MGYGLFVLNLPRIMPQITPNEISVTVAQILGGVALGQGFINIISIGFGIDSNRSVLKKLDEQAAHIQALEDKLTTANTLLQQLVDKASQPTTNALPNPANLTNMPDLTTKLASPDQAALASNGHVSKGS
ncbi:MAG: hypothetical protein H0X30_00280 [Anaerolineae bacterium]|nr:hypothetical protein [Anaerolineae bacterium]